MVNVAEKVKKELLPWGNVMGFRLPASLRKLGQFEPNEELQVDITTDGLLIRKNTTDANVHPATIMTTNGKFVRWGNSIGMQITGMMKAIPKFEVGELIVLELTSTGLLVTKFLKSE
ncbi:MULTISPECIES: AbrB/MazE/SpoVT family DNA-binding domain-containing protein [Yersinia pseudotuberculosis complex]|uniref:SpoVT-AbrB domain-containing protein n=1 Tax=Yersinia pseudotuberculosis serotype O:1b (strain IP 31758) TaxID=349747 RepID=A0A0U1QTD3_YERP3|nr:MULTISPECIES: hypothetical protein [Yersinia pseudotuberculosis complex]ABS45642.1 hypothetical protein YpsIP31758_B0084 [Yersinia pseudotuberculosis IP 31758]MCE4113246.1 hypothetical protein [Yersinia pseudotuberculosis]RYC26258.1 hypothetical protein EU971_11310 [Yersinia pseudotuberculosis]UFA64087.1 Uncharacterized protein YP598_4479 [Yersinia pseudotuberculosis]WLF06143.1 hypothetical protein Q6G25_21215 [Yersinia pseudotuberculosis]